MTAAGVRGATVRIVSLPAAVSSLQPFVDAGVLEPVDVHFAAALARLSGETSPAVLLGAALASRAPRHGHVCVDLRVVADAVPIEGADPDELAALPWPDPAEWNATLASSPAVAPGAAPDDDPRPLVLDRFRLYLERMWRDERFVAEELTRRALSVADDWADGLAGVIDQYFPDDPSVTGPDLQRRAATAMLRRSLTVIAGGPGTGKTRTLARTLAVLRQRPGTPLRVALAAPTGKAAARMGDAVRDELSGAGAGDLIEDLRPQTIHRLLGLGPRRRGAPRTLDVDLIIVDESSMVSLPLMAQLLQALAPATRLVLVGDPDQLTSVEAGTVLADIVGGHRVDTDPHRSCAPVGPLADAIVVLERPFRFASDSDIKPLADAIRAGDPGEVRRLLSQGRALKFVDSEDPFVTPGGAGVRPLLVAGAATTFAHAAAGDSEAALASTRAVRLLCAHRRGHHGVEQWNQLVERWLSTDVPGFAAGERWYVGRPVLLTRNDPVTRTNNGDVGVVVALPPDPGSGAANPEDTGSRHRVAVAVERQDGVALFRPVQLPDTETFHAMTIHKSQGSEFERVVVLLPPAGSRLATRELLYTAVTRARQELTVLGTWPALDAALGRRVTRASGLADALWPEPLIGATPTERPPDDARSTQLELF